MRPNFFECAAGSSKRSWKHKIAIMKYFNCAEFAVIPVNDYRARASYHYIATGQRLNASHYRELSQVEIPDDIDQCIDANRAEVHQDPAILEEQEPEDNDQDNEDENDDDDNVPEMSDWETDGQGDSEDDEEEIWEQFKSAQLAQHVFKKSPILWKKIWSSIPMHLDSLLESQNECQEY